MPLIGNRHSLGFELHPVEPSWDVRYEPERAAWAALAIWVDGQNLCRHIPAGSSQVLDALVLPLAPLGNWIVCTFPALRFQEQAALYPTDEHPHESAESWGDARPPAGIGIDDWFDARESWWEKHFLQAGSDGAYVPNLGWLRSDERLHISWRPPLFPSSTEVPTMVAPAGEGSLRWEEGVETLTDLLVAIAALMREGAAADAYPWAGFESPLATQEVELSSALELYTGKKIASLQETFGVGSYEEVLHAVMLSEDATDPAASAECQILRDFTPHPRHELGPPLRQLGEATSDERGADRMHAWSRLREQVLDAARPAREAIDAGSFGAKAVRRAFDLDGQPIEDVDALASRCGLDHRHLADVKGGQNRMMVGLREGGGATSMTFDTVRTRYPWSRRFETARALGHVLMDPLRGGAIGAASGTFAQRARHRRAGVFAAELLLPERALLEASGQRLDGILEGDAFERLLHRYKIGAQAAAHRLWDHHLLSSRAICDELIARHQTQE